MENTTRKNDRENIKSTSFGVPEVNSYYIGSLPRSPSNVIIQPYTTVVISCRSNVLCELFPTLLCVVEGI